MTTLGELEPRAHRHRMTHETSPFQTLAPRLFPRAGERDWRGLDPAGPPFLPHRRRSRPRAARAVHRRHLPRGFRLVRPDELGLAPGLGDAGVLAPAGHV